MAFEIQRRIPVRSVQTQKRNVPVDQIIAVQGQNPWAKGVDVLGNVLGTALQQRAALRRQGEELARLEAGYGLNSGELSGISDLGTAQNLAQDIYKQRQPTYVQQIGPNGEPTLLTIPAGGKFGGTVKTPGATSIPSIPRPKSLQNAGTTPDGRTVSYNPNSGQNQLSDGTPYVGTVLPKNVGTEEQRRQALVNGAKVSINDIRQSTTPEVLTELKAIRLSPGRIYSQLASPAAKKLYINLREAIANEIYLKTGATANPTELENATMSYLAALNDNPDDFSMRMDLLERNIEPFSARGGLNPLPLPPPSKFPKQNSKESLKKKLNL